MPGTTRTPAGERAVQWDSSRTVTRGVSNTVEQRRARALGQTQERDKRRGGGSQPPKSDGPPETLGNIFGLLWIAFGGIVIILCAIFVVGSIIMFGVLREISDARNFDAAASQTNAHEEFFKQVGSAGFKVASDKPNIKEGVTQYLWTVSPPNEGPMRVFSWQHDLENNEMRPTSNPAALLDIDLGLLDKAKAEEYSMYDGRRVFDFDPADPVTNAIIDRNASAFAKSNGEGWGQPGTAVIANAPPLPPPLFDPKSRTRKGVGAGAAVAEEEEEVTAEENPTEGEEGEQAQEPAPPAAEPEPEPEPPTEVIPAPPAEDAGDGNADDGGGERFPPPPGDDEGDGDGGDATPVG